MTPAAATSDLHQPSTRRRARLVLGGTAAAVLALAVAAVPAGAAPVAPADVAAAQPTPVPTVRGPLPVTPTSYPFGAADHQRVPEDLDRYGYVEEEYLVSGTANVYRWPAGGPAVVRTAGAPYTTRVLVRRPASRDAFSGNVVVEMLNPSNLYDLNIGWALSHRQFLDRGDVWVGITAKRSRSRPSRASTRTGTPTCRSPTPCRCPTRATAPTSTPSSRATAPAARRTASSGTSTARSAPG